MEKEVFSIDLDSEAFKSKVEGAIEAVETLFDGERLKRFSGALEGMFPVLAALGVAFVALKGTLETVLEAEKVKQINTQFEYLSRNVGLAASELKDKLVGATKGLADDTDVLEAANKALISMGSSARRLPEIMELAKKATSVFGGELIDNFSRMTQAIENGNVRGLRQYGIILNLDKVLRDYAAAHGTVVQALSDAEKKQAVMNAALEQGKRQFDALPPSVKPATNAIKEMQVILKNLGEAVTLAFEKVAGPTVVKALTFLKDFSKEVKNYVVGSVGDGLEQIEAQQAAAATAIEGAETELARLRALADKSPFEKALLTASGDIAKWETILKKAQEEYSKFTQQKHALEKEEKGKADEISLNKSSETLKAEIAQREFAALQKTQIESKFEADLLSLRMRTLQESMALATQEEQVTALVAQQKANLLEQLAVKERELLAEVALGTLTRQIADQKILEFKKQTELSMTRIQLEEDNNRLRSMENFARSVEKNLIGIAAGFKAAAAQGAKDFGNFAALGKQIFSSFSNNAASSLIALGDGSKDAAEALRGFMFGALADIADAQGKILIAQGFMGNFAAAAAGAGLLILSGFLRSLAGGKSAGAGAAPGAGGGGPIGAGGFQEAPTRAGPAMSTADERPSLEEERKKREVTVVVQGSYFETEQTRTRLLDMIRQETDATGFAYVQVGQGV